MTTQFHYFRRVISSLVGLGVLGGAGGYIHLMEKSFRSLLKTPLKVTLRIYSILEAIYTYVLIVQL